MESVISEKTNPEFYFMETLFLKVSSLLMPWVILGAIPRFQFGYWGQIEGQIVLLHIICSLLAINILVVLFRHKQLRFYTLGTTNCNTSYFRSVFCIFSIISKNS